MSAFNGESIEKGEQELRHRRDELHRPQGDLGVERSQPYRLPVREAEEGEGRA